VPLGFTIGIAIGKMPPLLILITTGYWGILNTAALAGFTIRGWFGTTPARWLRTTERRAAPSTAG
ncbi:MAG: hypothetical protein ACRDPA_24305, partial [Solirubrobacteraceae bacterium]